MGEHLPCKQGVKSSNLSVSIQACFTSEGIREFTHRDSRAKENAFESTQERAIEDCECGVEAKRLRQKHKPYLENRIMKLILKVSKMMIKIRHPRPTEMLEERN